MAQTTHSSTREYLYWYWTVKTRGRVWKTGGKTHEHLKGECTMSLKNIQIYTVSTYNTRLVLCNWCIFLKLLLILSVCCLVRKRKLAFLNFATHHSLFTLLKNYFSPHFHQFHVQKRLDTRCNGIPRRNTRNSSIW